MYRLVGCFAQRNRARCFTTRANLGIVWEKNQTQTLMSEGNEAKTIRRLWRQWFIVLPENMRQGTQADSASNCRAPKFRQQRRPRQHRLPRDQHITNPIVIVVVVAIDTIVLVTIDAIEHHPRDQQ